MGNTKELRRSVCFPYLFFVYRGGRYIFFYMGHLKDRIYLSFFIEFRKECYGGENKNLKSYR